LGAGAGVIKMAAENVAAFQKKWAEQVAPLFARAERGTFTGQGGVPIAYAVFRNPDSHRSLTIIQGYSESMAKYQELISDFYRAGYSVYIYDHRGMGFSGREVTNPQVVYVSDYRDYIEDARYFLKQIVPAGEPRFLFAHSMGALVAAGLLASEPGIVDAAVLNGPMFAINTGNYPAAFARAIVKANVSAGKGKEYAPGYANNDFEAAKFSAQVTTHSEMRFEQQRRIYRQYPITAMGGPSNNWVKVSMEAGDEVSAIAPSITTRLLLLQAQDDRLVMPAAEVDFCKQAPHCELWTVPGAYHETWREIDSIRTPVVERITRFLR
jgi:lysophospholipase